MFAVILAVILFVVAIGLFLAGHTTIAPAVEGDRYNAAKAERSFNLRPYALIPLILGFIILGFNSYDTVEPGQVGIPVTLGSTGSPLGTGFHLISPLTDVTHLSVKTKEYTMAADPTDGAKTGNDAIAVAGFDGAQGAVDVTTLYHIDEPKASDVFKGLGTNYEIQVVRPTVRDCIVAAYKAYPIVEDKTIHLSDVTAAATDCVKNGTDTSQGLASRGFVLEALQIRNTKLDDSVQASLDAKVAATNGVETATAAGNKTRIEAKATADSQQIIKCGSHTDPDGSVQPNTGGACENQLTPEYLQWWYTKMLDDTSQSPNHDTVIIPSGQTVTPFINTSPAK